MPVARSWSGVSPLTVAWVPTGMNAGVSTGPCGVCSRPRRAAEPGSREGLEPDGAWQVGSEAGKFSRQRSSGLDSDGCNRAVRAYSFLSFRPSSVSFSRTSLSEVTPKFLHSISSSPVWTISSPTVWMPSLVMHLRARTERFRSLIGLASSAFSSCDSSSIGSARIVVGDAFAAFERHAEPEALRGHHLLDLGERRLAEVLAGQQGGLGGPGEVAERPDVHLPQAVAAADRELEVGDGDLQQLLEDGEAALGLLVVVHVLAGAAVLEEEAGAGVVRVEGEHLAIARSRPRGTASRPRRARPG